ncbi:MAG: class I SAM-dependent methyltransferase [Alphaproteobacteria bacterium]
MTKDATKQAWDRQWRGKILSTCAQHMDPEAGREIGAQWAEFYGALAKGSKILDIGTGNGLLPLIALQVSDSTGKDFEVHGADLAEIDPAKAVPEQAAGLNRITFHSNCPSENLPFENNSLDAITAQHAFEYGDQAKSAAEVARILKKGGKIRFLIHAADSEIIKANTCKIEQSRYILDEAGLFELTLEAAKTGQGEDLRAALEKTDEHFSGDPNTADLIQLLDLLWGAYEQRDKFQSDQVYQHWIAENKAELAAQKLRIEALIEAAMDKAGVEALAKTFQNLGIKVKTSEIQAKVGGQVGWLLEGEKA